MRSLKISSALFILLCLFGFAEFANAEINLTPQLNNFKKACLLEREGIRNKDKYALLEAGDLFEAIGAEEFYFDDTRCNPNALSASVIQFNEEYCNAVVDNDCGIVIMETLHPMRGMDQEVAIASFSIAPGEISTFSSTGSDEGGILVISEDNAPLKVDITMDNSTFTLDSELDKTVHGGILKFPADDTIFSINVENLSDRKISFVIAVQ